MRIDIVTLFPELCDTFLHASILGRAADKGLFEAHCHQIRDYTLNKQKQTDDYPYGGGCGMVLYAQPIADCLREVTRQCEEEGRPKPHIVFMTAGGKPYNLSLIHIWWTCRCQSAVPLQPGWPRRWCRRGHRQRKVLPGRHVRRRQCSR